MASMYWKDMKKLKGTRNTRNSLKKCLLYGAFDETTSEWGLLVFLVLWPELGTTRNRARNIPDSDNISIFTGGDDIIEFMDYDDISDMEG
jgi:hypothetical protein